MNTSSNYIFHFTKKYASYLLQHSLDELIQENMKLVEEFKLPLMEMFRHINREEVEKLVKGSLQSFLENILEDKALE